MDGLYKSINNTLCTSSKARIEVPHSNCSSNNLFHQNWSYSRISKQWRLYLKQIQWGLGKEKWHNGLDKKGPVIAVRWWNRTCGQPLWHNIHITPRITCVCVYIITCMQELILTPIYWLLFVYSHEANWQDLREGIPSRLRI